MPHKYSGLETSLMGESLGGKFIIRCIFVSRSADSDSMIGMNLLNLPIKFTELKLASSERIRLGGGIWQTIVLKFQWNIKWTSDHWQRLKQWFLSGFRTVSFPCAYMFLWVFRVDIWIDFILLTRVFWTPVRVGSVHFCDLQVAWVALLWSDKYCYSSCDPVFNTNSVATLCRQLQEKQALGIFSVESSLAKTKFTFCQKKAFDKVFACLSQYSLLLLRLLTFVQLLESFRCNRLQVGLIWNGATLRRGGCTRPNLPRLWQGGTRLKAPFSLFTRTQKVTEISRIQVPVCFR